MKILIIEDDEYKANQIGDLINSKFGSAIILTIKQSFQTGMKAIIQEQFDLLLLDMSMPSFEGSGRHRAYAGLDILSEMRRKSVQIPTIVVTQYNIFGEGEERKDATQLDKLLREGFSEMYLDMVYYNAKAVNWKEKLADMINFIKIGEVI